MKIISHREYNISHWWKIEEFVTEGPRFNTTWQILRACAPWCGSLDRMGVKYPEPPAPYKR